MKTVALLLSALAVSSVLAETRLEPGKKSEEFAFEVKPGSICHLAFRAKIDGEMTVEKNRQLAEAFYDIKRETRGLRWPRWHVTFSFPSGKTAKNGGTGQYWNSIISGQWRKYDDLFQIPRGCTKVSVSFSNPSKIDALVFEPPTVEPVKTPYVNQNPDFAYGRCCHAGYSLGWFGTTVRMKRTAEGKQYMHVADWTSMDGFLVEPNHRYEVDIALMPWVKVGSVNNVTFSDAAGKKVPKSEGTLIAKAKTLGGKDVFIAPANAERMSILLRGTDYKYIRVKDLGEAKK